MTKKDYKLIAGAINYAIYTDTDKRKNNSEVNFRTDWIINQISYELKRDNPRFDEKKFYSACTELTELSRNRT